MYELLPSATRTGYIFNGWATSGGTVITENVIISIPEDHTLYAQWSTNSYLVTFDANGGSPSISNATLEYGSVYGELPTPTRPGYTFIGWYSDKTAGTVVTKDTIMNTTSNHSIYARWEVNNYTITLNTNNGYFGTTTEIETSFKDKTIILKENTSKPTYASSILNLSANQQYLVTFDYISDGKTTFDVDFLPDSLPQIYPTATTTKQTYNWITSSSNNNMEKCQLRFFNDVTIM